MTTSEMIQIIYDNSYVVYKKTARKTEDGSKLDRKEPVTIDGILFSCWREYVMYKVAQYLQEKLPYADVKVELNGNDTNIDLTCSEEEQQKLNASMYGLIKEYCIY